MHLLRQPKQKKQEKKEEKKAKETHPAQGGVAAGLKLKEGKTRISCIQCLPRSQKTCHRMKITEYSYVLGKPPLENLLNILTETVSRNMALA